MFALVLALLWTAAPAPAPAPAPGEPPAERVRNPRQAVTPPVREGALERRLERAKRALPCEAEDVFSDLWVSFRVCRACVGDEILARQIELSIRLVESTPEDDVDYPDYLFRLADLYLEDKARHEREAANLQAHMNEQACVTSRGP